MPDFEQAVVNTVKGLVMDATRKANSGHPGGAMSSADFACVLFRDFLNYDPADPEWSNRDRFVLSAGHESMLLYSLLFLQGALTLDDLKRFRQLDSRTPGHPEVHRTPGVSCTTGPLGQGLGMAVGMAVAESWLRAELGPEGCDHYTYVLAGDGDLQEPLALGSAALAGLWGLGRLIVYYDNNRVQITGCTDQADGTDHHKAFEACGWQVLEVDGHDRGQIRAALGEARAETARPTLIIGHTVMAKGASSLEGSAKTHGSPLPEEEILATKRKLGLDPKPFQVPESVISAFRERDAERSARAEAWRKGLAAKCAADAGFAARWKAFTTPRGELKLVRPSYDPAVPVPTRKAWGMMLNANMDALGNLLGGSADLDPSNSTQEFRDHVGLFTPQNRTGRAFAFGVREFPMAAVVNGLALHGGILPFGATFLVFSDYCRNAVRLAALQEAPSLFVFTHDSFYVGEDGPTHQPVEHIPSLRLIPDLMDLRPADANETAACIELALRSETYPSVLLLTRQKLPVLNPVEYPAVLDGPVHGGYILKDCEGTPEMILIATGSEVHLALGAARLLAPRKVRVVSMPSVFLFERQSEEYKRFVLPPEVRKRAAVEAARTAPWYRYVGLDGLVLGIDHFGLSAPHKDLEQLYGFTAENLARLVVERWS